MSVMSERIYTVRCDMCGTATPPWSSHPATTAPQATMIAHLRGFKQVAINRWLCTWCAKDEK